MPVIKLNDKSIRALKAPDPSGQQTFYWDENQTGFAVLVSGKTKTKSFVAKGQLNGKGVLKSLGKVGVMTQDEARQAARECIQGHWCRGASASEESISADAGRDLDGLPVRQRPQATDQGGLCRSGQPLLPRLDRHSR